LGIVCASAQSEVPGGPEVPGFDKVVHFGVFGALATAAVRLVPGRHAGWVLVGVSLFGASDEWHQSFTAGRSVELADWIADALGATVAVLAYTRWAWYRALLEKRVLQVRPLPSVAAPAPPRPESSP
jgi:VanZ family protein